MGDDGDQRGPGVVQGGRSGISNSRPEDVRIWKIGESWYDFEGRKGFVQRLRRIYWGWREADWSPRRIHWVRESPGRLCRI